MRKVKKERRPENWLTVMKKEESESVRQKEKECSSGAGFLIRDDRMQIYSEDVGDMIQGSKCKKHTEQWAWIKTKKKN